MVPFNLTFKLNIASLDPDKITVIWSLKDILYSFGRGKSPTAEVDVGVEEKKL